MKQFTLLILTLFLFSCQPDNEKLYSIISGKIENNQAESVAIRGTDYETQIPISANGNFSDTLYLKNNGFYQLFIGREQTGIYLEKGHDLNVAVDMEQFDESLDYTGSLANPNNFLAKKYLYNEQNLDFEKLFSLDENDFITELETRQKILDSLLESENVANKTFKDMLNEEDTYSKAALVENYLVAHRYYTGFPDFQVSKNFYQHNENIDFKDTLVFRNSAAYQNLLDAHFNRLATQQPIDSSGSPTLAFLRIVDSNLPDGFAKDKIMVQYLEFGLKPDADIEEVYTLYKNTNPEAENLAGLTERYKQLQTITKGNPSPTFNFENHNGGTTSLDDLRGNYVYIDVWATWCGPCIREIPALKEIENQYKGKNIHFVGISIDEPRDYQKWRMMVSEKEMAGIQLMADNNWESEFVNKYVILGIPRFILIDPQGNIVNADAPRPSDPKLSELLDSLI